MKIAILFSKYTPKRRGVCRISQGGGPTLRFLGFWMYMPRSGMSRAAKLRAFARGGLGACPPKKIFKNGAISCVLRAILTTFMVKNPLKKL